MAGGGKPSELVVTVISGLASGGPVQAIVQAFGLDERTHGGPAFETEQASTASRGNSSWEKVGT